MSPVILPPTALIARLGKQESRIDWTVSLRSVEVRTEIWIGQIGARLTNRKI